ncbi:unnamed protein product [Cochlearia groenlandica]
MFWKHDPTLIVRAGLKKSDDARVGNYTAGNLYMALYLLICGEAANLRFISQSVSAPFYHHEHDPTLMVNVKNNDAREMESLMALNSKDAGWEWKSQDRGEMLANADFFYPPARQPITEKVKIASITYYHRLCDHRITPSQALIVSRDRCVGKVKFFELRFFWHVLRSSVFGADVFNKVPSVFKLAAIMKLGKGWHLMVFELCGMLAGNVGPITGKNVKPAYGGEEDAFLRKVVTPIYEVMVWLKF